MLHKSLIMILSSPVSVVKWCLPLFFDTTYFVSGLVAKSHLSIRVVLRDSRVEADVNADIRCGSLFKVDVSRQ